MSTIRTRSLTAVAVCGLAILVGCSGGRRTVGEGTPDLEAMRAFDRHPLYWVGKRFEKWDLERVGIGNSEFVSFSYGTCELPAGIDPGGCAVPLQIQIQPLCTHLGAVARAPIWRRREVRGAPVGTIDSAPVMFTDRVQIKVYRGQGSDPGLALRALRALRSANAVQPVVHLRDPMPPAPLDVLAGSSPCGVPGPLELGRWVCAPQVERRSCAGPTVIGVRHLYVLRTHCGIFDAYFAGRLWRATPPLTDGSGNPPRGWDNPEQLGTMRLIRSDLAEFRARGKKLVSRFTPAPSDRKVVVCD
ncbi:MAG: hypothetical protein M3540_01275 [Actinomycetota bacterium]|nr:hypothetical protein [Actinomycetota bacterium]